MRASFSIFAVIAAISWPQVAAFTPDPTMGVKSIPKTLGAASEKPVPPPMAQLTAAAAAAAAATANVLPLAALAAEKDEYVYGAVDAPPLVPIVGGVLAILTALLPVLLRSGEEAFEDMKDRDGFGSGRDQLKKRK